MGNEIKPNEQQKDCINNIYGKYLILAGPGTGKTYTIVERIKNIISKGVEPEKILCLTFTDAGASEMKKRIEKDLNVISCDVQIYTYHSFCSSIIDEFIEEFDIPSNYKIISDPISKALIKECIEELNPKYFRTNKNDPYFYIKTIKNRISEIKQYRLSKEQYFNNLEQNLDWVPEKIRLEKKIKEKQEKGDTRTKGDEADLESITKKINQAKELWVLYDLYKEKMTKSRYIDFNDMINLVLDKFENNPSFLNKIANRYEFIMVDEYQDTNKSQNDIVFALSLAISTGNTFVVGDDDQIIYRFQGAKLDTIENFLKEFPDTQIVCLTENMRSTQTILDTARAVISQDPLSLVNKHLYKDKYNQPINKNLVAKNEEIIQKDTPVRFYKYADIMQEYTEIVKEIEEIINSPQCPKDKTTGDKLYSEIAILTRTNSEAESFAQMLKIRNIPFELKEGKDIFTIPAVNILYFYMQFLINPEMYSNRIFELLVSPPFSINFKDFQIIYNEHSKEKTFIDTIKKIPRENLSEPEKIERFLQTYEYLKEYKTKETIKNTILEIGSKTGIFDYYLNTDINKTENIAGIKQFIDEASGFSEIYQTSFIEEFCNYIQSIISDEESIKTEKAPVNLNAVQLCTYHSSKGREFEYVYMPTLETYKWESSAFNKPDIPLNSNEFATKEKIDNEIKPSDLTKLLYVAMTRAKHTLRMSYPEKINNKIRKPTKYITNIQDMLEKEKEPFEYNEQSYWAQVNNLLIKKDYNYQKEFESFIQTKLINRVYSASSINKYLACPRQYLYDDILELQPKNGNPNNLSYGSSVHKACENAINFLIENKKAPPKEDFIEWFKQDLSKRPMNSYQQRLIYSERGEKALDKYYCQIINTPPSNLISAEQSINHVFEDGTKFIAIIDRIDKNEDGTYSIYDYKTGNNKNSGIKPGGEYENYYNQMAIYKYIYEIETGNKVSITKFIYPEDFTSSNREINYKQEDIGEVVKKYQQAIKNIYSYKFNPTPKEKICKYCNFKDFCGLNIL